MGFKTRKIWPLAVMLMLTSAPVLKAAEDDLEVVNANGQVIELKQQHFKSIMSGNLQQLNSVMEQELASAQAAQDKSGWKIEEVWIGTAMKFSINVLTALKLNATPGVFVIFKPRK